MVRFPFFSRSKQFFEMFGEAARNMHQGAKALQHMVEEYENNPEQWRSVEEYEHEGDRITHRLMHTLHTSSLRAADREDIHRLAATLDDVLDLIEGSAARLVMYQVAKTTPAAVRLAGLIVQCTGEIVQVVSALPEADRVQPHCIELNRIENEADDVARQAIADLFSGNPAPLDVIKWKEIYETMETATDRGEDVANLLEEMVLKRS